MKVPGLLETELSGKTVSSLRDLAAAYAAALAKCDRAEPFDDPERQQFRAVLRGPASPADVPVDEFELIYTEGDSNNTRSIRVRYNAMLAQAAYDGAAPRAMAVEDVPSPAPGHVFVRGNPNNPGALAPPRFLSCLGGGDDKVFRNGSGRLELAQAIIDPANPLTARVIVNRVWMHHFGFGIVRTPSDFGFRGDPPTHPELLDYLAVKFVESGWSLKKLHRLIMTSAAYRQGSADNEAARKIDPENQLLWRMNRRRLEIEAVRDSMLAAAGRLDLTAGGMPFPLTAEPSIPRRSVYGFIERGRIPALLNAFDFASPDQHAPLRYVTTVPQQALFFLNSPFVAEQSSALANRSEIATASSPSEKIERMYQPGLWPGPGSTGVGGRLEIRFAERRTGRRRHRSHSPWQYGTGRSRCRRRTSRILYAVRGIRIRPLAGRGDTAGLSRRQGGAARGGRRTGRTTRRGSGPPLGEPGFGDARASRVRCGTGSPRFRMGMASAATSFRAGTASWRPGP